MFSLNEIRCLDDLKFIYNGILMYGHEVGHPSGAGQIQATLELNFQLTRSRFVWCWIVGAAELDWWYIVIHFNDGHIIRFTCRLWSHIKH